MDKCKIYSLINYFDVWGNETDGYEVNNQCVEKTGIHIPDDVKDYEVIDYLKSIKFITQECKMSDFDVNMACDYIEVNTSNGYPLCCFMTEG